MSATTTTTRKIRPKSLRKKIAATSNLPKLLVEVSIDDSHDTEKLDSPSPNVLKEMTHSLQQLKIQESKILSLGCVDKGHIKILSESTQEIDSDPEDFSTPQDNGFSLLSPITNHKEVSLSRSAVNNTSSISLDSGVCSARESHRTSIELLSPEGTEPNLQWTSPLHKTSRGSSHVSPILSVTESSESESIATIIEDSVFNSVTCNKPEKLSVSTDTFAELLQVAMKLVDDVQPIYQEYKDGPYLKNSLKETNRRKSHMDKPQMLLEQKRESFRKLSAEPVLQRSSNDLVVQETGSRKKSACIICKRNKKISGSVTTNVLIKTTMVRNMQERRRYSEVLRVS